jgi:hypothetical protein
MECSNFIPLRLLEKAAKLARTKQFRKVIVVHFENRYAVRAYDKIHSCHVCFHRPQASGTQTHF